MVTVTASFGEMASGTRNPAPVTLTLVTTAVNARPPDPGITSVVPVSVTRRDVRFSVIIPNPLIERIAGPGASLSANEPVRPPTDTGRLAAEAFNQSFVARMGAATAYEEPRPQRAEAAQAYHNPGGAEKACSDRANRV